MIDGSGQEHDYVYWENNTGGLKGLWKNQNVYQADVKLFNAAQAVIDGYHNGDIDPVTGSTITGRTYNIARIVRAAVGTVVLKKTLKEY